MFVIIVHFQGHVNRTHVHQQEGHAILTVVQIIYVNVMMEHKYATEAPVSTIRQLSITLFS